MDAAQGETLDLAFALPTAQQIASLSISSFGYALPAHQLPVYHRLVCDFFKLCNGLKLGQLVAPGTGINAEAFDAAKEKASRQEENTCRNTETRAFTLLPVSCADNPYGAWTLRCHLNQDAGDDTITESSNFPLKGKLVAIKDNIPIRGMPMWCGTPFSFTPLADSPLITRCLAAGATIVGKAQCEYMCFSGASHTASAGVVRNPLNVEYHAGGSSSGCGVLVASGEADLSIGCDQGGSCRIPSAVNGVVACKPTYGLVPYTLIDSLYCPIDHAGPITRTVEDNALMLGVLAGWDGTDKRANAVSRKMKKIDYCSELKIGVGGMRIGIVKEGFETSTMEADVISASDEAAKLLRELGAVVESVSLPLHRTGCGIWAWYVMQRFVEGLFYAEDEIEEQLVGVDEHGKQCNRRAFLRDRLLANVASWSVPFRTTAMAGEWLRLHHPEAAKAGEAYKEQLIDGYKSALSCYEVLMMPTIPCRPRKLPEHLSRAEDYERASAELVAEQGDVAFGMVANTMATNLTGHPAVSVPVGGSIVKEHEAQETKPVAFPVSLMLVGDYFQEATLYRVAYALQEARPWHSFLFHEGHLVEASY